MFPARETPAEARGMIDAWIAAHGGVRRFQRGESTDFVYLQRWLYLRGYVLSAAKGSFYLRRGDGDRRQAKWREVIVLVDTLRVGEGLQTIQAPCSTGPVTDQATPSRPPLVSACAGQISEFAADRA